MKVNLKYSLIITLVFGLSFISFFFIVYEYYKNLTVDFIMKSYENNVIKLSELLSKSMASLESDFFSKKFIDEKNGYYYILDENGNVIYHTDLSKIGINAVEDTKLPELYKYIKENKSGIYKYVYENEKRFVAFSSFEFNNSTYYLANAITEKQLFYDINKVKMFSVILLVIMMVFLFFISYVIGKLIEKEFKKQIGTIKEFSTNVSSYIAENSSASSEIGAVAQNTQKNVQKLDELIQNFSSSIEEGRSELDLTLSNMKEFFYDIQNMNEKTLEISNFINKLSDLNDKIKDISDTVSILSINSSIETSKENLDREGISKIAELINELASESRETSKNSEKILKEIEKNITTNVLLSEKTSKELTNIEKSLDSVSEIVRDFEHTVQSLSNFSHSTKISMNEVLSGINQMSEALIEIKNSMDKLLEIAKKFEK
ncbi:methyl-accepting chemotaxis protein [Marinitoga sp. 1155]|uniref:methyl-accepting chemotaxis protein n=1 Tax=Marinitoga sp. 1155 TaxID=1428448 RepID=UPI0006412B2F|nr:methyl-accepting chemotaxis protein [Marinitoga sp. 1155]KLO22378.1 hypothetical protein X274_08645 [Marinitoga sp. 1155]